MIGDNVNKTVKRYTDLEKARASRTACRALVITFSVLFGVLIIVLSIYFVNRAKSSVSKPPVASQVNDADYSEYLRAQKVLPVWSWTNESKYAGQPAYLQFYSNRTLRSVLTAFAAKHNFTEAFLFAGSVQYSQEAWGYGQFPGGADFERFVASLAQSGLGADAVIYINDDPTNMTDSANLKLFAKAAQQFNMLNNKTQIRRVLVQQHFADDQEVNIKLLEALYQLQKVNQPSNIETLVLVNEYGNDIIQQNTLNIYGGLSIAGQISGGQTIYDILHTIGVTPVVFLNQSTEYDYLNQIQALKDMGYTKIYVMNWAEGDDGGAWLDAYQQLIINAQSVASDIVWVPDSYYRLYRTMYQTDPVAEGWEIDLYKTK